MRIDETGQNRHKIHFLREKKRSEDKYSIRFNQRLEKAKRML